MAETIQGNDTEKPVWKPDRMDEKIAKQRLNVILMVDCSTSMRGERIGQVNHAIHDIKQYLTDLQNENVNVDFYLTVITYSTEAFLLNHDRMKAVEEFDFKDIRAGGWSNLHTAYLQLADLLKKEAKGGIMPDFGGVAPIVLLLTDGHPTKWPLTEEMEILNKLPWFKVAIRYGIAIELNDGRTVQVLRDFVGENGDVITCFDAKLLEKIIKIIVMTASKVKSSDSTTTQGIGQNTENQVTNDIRQQIQQTISDDIDSWEWQDD